jgi:hypothetical protein
MWQMKIDVVDQLTERIIADAERAARLYEDGVISKSDLMQYAPVLARLGIVVKSLVVKADKK